MTCADSGKLVDGKALIGYVECSVCGKPVPVYAAPEHYIDTTDPSVTVVEATCEHGGYVVGECAICGEAEVTMWTGNSTAHDFIEYVLEVDEEKNVYVVTGLCSYCGGWEYVSEGTLYDEATEILGKVNGALANEELKVGVYAEGDYDPETKTLATGAKDCWNETDEAYTLPTHLNAGWRVYAYTTTITVDGTEATYTAYDAEELLALMEAGEAEDLVYIYTDSSQNYCLDAGTPDASGVYPNTLTYAGYVFTYTYGATYDEEGNLTFAGYENTILFVIYEVTDAEAKSTDSFTTWVDDDGTIWKNLVNHDCESHAGTYDSETGLYVPTNDDSFWGGWEKDGSGLAYVYVAEAIYVDGTPLTDKDGNQLYYFYYRCEYCGAFYKVGEYSYPETMPLYSEDFKTADNEDGLFEVTVDHIAMGWIWIPVNDEAFKDLEFTDADADGLCFTVGLYLDEATCAAFNEILGETNNAYLGVTNGWENAILFILDGTENGTAATFYCFVTIVEDEDGTTWYYWEVTVAADAPLLL